MSRGALIGILLTPANLGMDQRKLFVAAKEWLPKLGYRQVSSSNPGLYS